nr:MAG TPA_asm: hypothetical protein [Caudoviricetes sp.]
MKTKIMRCWLGCHCLNRSMKGAKIMKIEKETKVVILQNGNAVMATQYVNGKKVNASTARCCPEDAFDFAFGAKLALERLLDCMGSAPETAFDWDRFISGDVWVQTNSSNTDAFLQACEEHHLTDRTGDRPTELNVFRDFNNASEIEKALYGIFGMIPKENIWFATRDGKLRWGNEKPTGEIFEWGQAE